ncbi:MAG: hypothetical protein LBC77_02865 [Spirochaetaceae bacterium]|jgi:hypothetical protein|nr:hypothetical protein [Spirochaetaceae bacterium]
MNIDVEKMKSGQREIDNMIQTLADSKKDTAVKSGVTKDRLGDYDPVADGAFDFEKYAKSDTKIMFVGREPNSPGDGGWDFKEVPINNESFFGLMNGAANGILNNDCAPMKNTVFVNISNFSGKAGPQGTMAELYNENKEIFEKKVSVYRPDVVVCHNTAELCWPSLQKELGFNNYTAKYFDRHGDEIPLDQNNQPVEKAAVAAYYCDNGKTIIDTSYPAAQHDISQADWINGVVNAHKNNPNKNNQKNIEKRKKRCIIPTGGGAAKSILIVAGIVLLISILLAVLV